METIKKTDLTDQLADKTGMSKSEAKAALDGLVELISDNLKKGNKIQLTGFGTFEMRDRKAREGRNPSTGETIQIAASKAPTFKAGKALKDAIN